MEGKLNVMVVTPQQASIHPEWRELFDQSSQAIQQQFLNMRHLGRRVGYFITDIRKGSTNSWAMSAFSDLMLFLSEETGDDLEKIYSRERGSKGKTSERSGSGSSGEDATSAGSGNSVCCAIVA